MGSTCEVCDKPEGGKEKIKLNLQEGDALPENPALP
jgi:hypothetical protein